MTLQPFSTDSFSVKKLKIAISSKMVELLKIWLLTSYFTNSSSSQKYILPNFSGEKSNKTVVLKIGHQSLYATYMLYGQCLFYPLIF